MRLTLVRLIQLLNLLVFAAWHLLMSDRYGIAFMADNFLVSWSALTEGRPWTLLTSAFSHTSFFHLFINMYVLGGFGSTILSIFGKKRFLWFYLLAGICGSLAHSLVSAFLLHDPELPALGASGAIAGIVLLFSLLFPREKLLLLGFIPLSARWGALVVVGIDLYGLWTQMQGGGLPIGHGAHLGGALVGVIYYLMLKRRAKRAQW